MSPIDKPPETCSLCHTGKMLEQRRERRSHDPEELRAKTMASLGVSRIAFPWRTTESHLRYFLSCQDCGHRVEYCGKRVAYAVPRE